jgi:hypothetical protein
MTITWRAVTEYQILVGCDETIHMHQIRNVSKDLCSLWQVNRSCWLWAVMYMCQKYFQFMGSEIQRVTSQPSKFNFLIFNFF